MLKKINAGRVESDTGFYIEITGPELFEYNYHGKLIEIDLAYDPLKSVSIIYASQVKDLNVEEKNKMIANIEQAVQLLGGKFVII